MRKNTFSQTGIGHIVLVMVIVFAGVVGVVGWKVFGSNQASTQDASVVVSPKVPEKISTKADLVQTSKALDSASTSVNGGLNDDALDADLNDLL